MGLATRALRLWLAFGKIVWRLLAEELLFSSLLHVNRYPPINMGVGLGPHVRLGA